MLEARDVPAAFYWNPLWSPTTGVNGNTSVASNWTDGVSSRYSTPPGGADDLYFPGHPVGSSSGPSYPSAAATINSGGVFKSIHIYDYGLSVTTSVDVTVETLELRRGNIVQQNAASSGGKLVVTNRFDWTGGDLNAYNSTAGLVTLSGATGLIDPGTGNTVRLGSTLELDASQVDFVEGTLMLIGGGLGINVNAGSDFNIGGSGESEEENFGGQPPAGQPAQPLPERVKVKIEDMNDPYVEFGKRRIHIFGGGTVSVKTLGGNKISEVTVEPFVQNSGDVLIDERAEVAFTAWQPTIVTGDEIVNASFFQGSGRLVIAHGSKVEFTNWAVFRGGDISTFTRETVPQGSTKRIADAMIVGNVISYANIAILPSASGIFADLKIDGNLDWRAGTLNVRLDGRSPDGVASKEKTALLVSKTLKVDTGTNAIPRAKIRAVVEGLAGVPVANGRKWQKVVTAGTKIQLQIDGSVDSMMINSGYKVDEKAVMDGNDRVVREWDIVKE